MDRFNLTGKVAVITGGTGSLGAEHTFALAEKNALVIAIDLNKKKFNCDVGYKGFLNILKNK